MQATALFSSLQIRNRDDGACEKPRPVGHPSNRPPLHAWSAEVGYWRTVGFKEAESGVNSAASEWAGCVHYSPIWLGRTP